MTNQNGTTLLEVEECIIRYGVMRATFVKYLVAHLSDQVLELVCDLAYLIIITIMSHCMNTKRGAFSVYVKLS